MVCRPSDHKPSDLLRDRLQDGMIAIIYTYHRHLLLLLISKADAHFTDVWSIRGRVDLGTAIKVFLVPSPRLYIAVVLALNAHAHTGGFNGTEPAQPPCLSIEQ